MGTLKLAPTFEHEKLLARRVSRLLTAAQERDRVTLSAKSNVFHRGVCG